VPRLPLQGLDEASVAQLQRLIRELDSRTIA